MWILNYGFPISTLFYVLVSFVRDIILGIDVISMLNLAITEEGITNVGECYKFQTVFFIIIIENYVNK